MRKTTQSQHAHGFLAALIIAALAAAVPIMGASAQMVRVTLLDGRQVAVRQGTLRSFTASDAESAVSRIVSVTGLKSDFKVLPVEDPAFQNAAAGMDETGARVILYSPKFLDEMKGGGDRGWAATGVFAHEIGHHLSAHTLGNGRLASAALRQQELDADEFAGVQLARLEASESQAVLMLASAAENATFSHPERAARDAAVRRGWCAGSGGRPAQNFAPATGQSACVGGRGARGGTTPPVVAPVVRAPLFDLDFRRNVAGSGIPEMAAPHFALRHTFGGLAFVQTAYSPEMLTLALGTVMPDVVEIEAEAQVLDGEPRASGWGLGFGADANGAGYHVFTFNAEGKYGVVRHVPGGEWARVVGELDAPGVFNTGRSAINKLAVRLNGSRATLIANGRVLTTIDLGKVPTGRPMLFATPARNGVPTTVVFFSFRATPQ